MVEPEVAIYVGRFGRLLGLAVGLTWGPMLAHLGFVLARSDHGVVAILLCLAGIVAGAAVGARVPTSYYRLRDWEQAGRGQVYERYARLRAFKRWMLDGDLMNAWLRRRSSGYRVVRRSPESVRAFAERTRRTERAHLIWLLAAIAPLISLLAVGAWGFATLWTLLNLLTNVWPMMLQRYNRVRVERVGGGGWR